MQLQALRSASTCFTHKYSYDNVIFFLHVDRCIQFQDLVVHSCACNATFKEKEVECFFSCAPNWAIEKMRNTRAQCSYPVPLTTSCKWSFNTLHHHCKCYRVTSPCCPLWPHSTTWTTWKKPVFCLDDGLLTNMPSTIPLGKNCSPLVKAPQEVKDTHHTTITTITITIDIRVHVRDWKRPNARDCVAY